MKIRESDHEMWHILVGLLIFLVATMAGLYWLITHLTWVQLFFLL